jgi:hypothetical protein
VWGKIFIARQWMKTEANKVAANMLVSPITSPRFISKFIAALIQHGFIQKQANRYSNHHRGGAAHFFVAPVLPATD